MTNVEVCCFFLGWGFLLHAVYLLSPVAMEMVIALGLLMMAVPRPPKAKV